MSVLDWLTRNAYVDRHVNMLYFLVVTCITLSVLGAALYTRDRRAVRIFWYSVPVWAGIEGFGLVTGMRVYESYQPMVFFFVAFVEDSGWVTLAYMVSARLHEWSLKVFPPG